MDTQDKRNKAVNLKLSPVVSEIEGKSIILVDDSIVRGTTSKKLIELVRRAGAKKVVFVSTCPPIKHPCYYGIDFPVENELVAYNRSNEEIEKELGADAVIYLDIPRLVEALNESAAPNKTAGKGGRSGALNPCMACLNGEYPSDVSEGSRFAKGRDLDRTSAPS